MPVRAKKLAAQSETRLVKPKSATQEVEMGSVVDQFAHWLANRDKETSPLTISGYLADLDKFVQWFRLSSEEEFGPTTVTAVDVRQYKAHLQTVENFKPATINRRLAVLRTFFAWAVENQLVSENPIRVRNVEELPTAPRSLTEREYSKLLRTAQRSGDKRTTAILELLRHSGLRVTELCSLKLADVIVSDRKDKVVVRSGKGKHYREVPLNLDARLALKSYLAIRPAVDDQHLFIGQRLNGLTDSGIQRVVAEVGRQAGIEGVSPHVLRHTFGKSLDNQKVSPFAIKNLMGHKRMDTTARYTTPTVRDLEEAVAKLQVEE